MRVTFCYNYHLTIAHIPTFRMTTALVGYRILQFIIINRTLFFFLYYHGIIGTELLYNTTHAHAHFLAHLCLLRRCRFKNLKIEISFQTKKL